MLIKRDHVFSGADHLIDNSRDNMWALGGRGIYVCVNTFKGDTKIHIRKYSRNDSGRLHATKDGITLNPSEWQTFMDSLGMVDQEVKRLECERQSTVSGGDLGAFGGIAVEYNPQ